MTDLTFYQNEVNRQARWAAMTPEQRAKADAERSAAIDAAQEGSKAMVTHAHENRGAVGPVAQLPVVIPEQKPLPKMDSTTQNRHYTGGRHVTEAEIKAGRTLDGTYKYWPNVVYGKTPVREHHITTHTVHKYNWWRRIEDIRNVYNAEGILLSKGKQYTFELSAYPVTQKDKQDAIEQLLHATVEYGNVCPGPFTERWVETDSEILINVQHFIHNLYDFYAEKNLLEFADIEQRKQVWEFVKEFENMNVALEHVNKYWISKNTLGNAKQAKSISKKIKRAMR